MVGFFVSMLYTMACGSAGAVVGRFFADLITDLFIGF